MKGVLREDIAKTKGDSGAVIGENSLSRSSTFFSGKRRSVVAFLMIMVYMLTPVEGRAVRNAVGNRGARGVNRRINSNQRGNPRKNRKRKPDNNNINNNKNNDKKKEEEQNNGLWIVAGVAGAASIIAGVVAAARGALVPQHQAQRDQPQEPQAQRDQPQEPQAPQAEPDSGYDPDPEDASKFRIDPKSKPSQKKSKSNSKSKFTGLPPVLGLGGGCGGIPVGLQPVLDVEIPVEPQPVLDVRIPIRLQPVLDVEIPVEPQPILDVRIPVRLQPVLDVEIPVGPPPGPPPVLGRRIPVGPPPGPPPVLGVRVNEEERTRWDEWFTQRLETLIRHTYEEEDEEEKEDEEIEVKKERMRRIRKERATEGNIDRMIEERVTQNFERYRREFPGIGNLPPPIAFIRIRDAYRDIADLAWLRMTIYGANEERYRDLEFHPPRNESDWEHAMQDIALLRFRRANARNPEFEGDPDLLRIDFGEMLLTIEQQGDNIENTLRGYLKRIRRYEIAELFLNIAPYL
jgi:hypothetical protein